MTEGVELLACLYTRRCRRYRCPLFRTVFSRAEQCERYDLPSSTGPRATSQFAANTGRAATDSFRYPACCPLLVDVTW